METPVFRPETKDFKLTNSVLAPYVFTMSLGYLKAAGTRLLSGRDVSWQDNTTTPYVAVINQTFAQAMWGETPAIGQHFIVSGHLTEVVGVAENGKYHDMQETPQAVAYLPILQGESDEAVLVVRSKLAPSEIAVQLERALNRSERNVPITVRHWDDTLASRTTPGTSGDSGPGRLGPVGSSTGGNGHLRHGSLQRESTNAGARHPRGTGRTPDASNECRRGATDAAAWRGIISGHAGRSLREHACSDRLCIRQIRAIQP